MKALVTGATGFAGTWLCRYLRHANHQVVGWARNTPAHPVPGVHYESVNVQEESMVRERMTAYRPNTVFHLAAMAHLGDCEKSPKAAFHTNVLGTQHVLSAMPREARAVFASTCHVYGAPTELPVTESHPLNPYGVYATTKQQAEHIATGSDKDVVVVRAFHHTGPGQQTHFALADWANQIRIGTTTIQVGNIDVARDYSDVRDVVAGYMLAAEAGEGGQVYNLCSGVSQPMREILTEMIGTRPIEVLRQPDRYRPNDILDFCGDPTKIQALGWIRKFTLSETLQSLLG